MNVGRAIRLVRTAKGMAQKELAVQAKCSGNYLSLVERGEKTPSLEFIERISAALSVPAVELFALATDDDAGSGQRDELVRSLKQLLLVLDQTE